MATAIKASTSASAPSNDGRQDTPRGTFNMDVAGESITHKMVPVICYGLKKDGLTPYEFTTMMRVISESETSLEVVSPKDVQVIQKG